jgi:hypothetical protein
METQMNKRKQEMEIGFTQEILPECHHLCLIFDDKEQRRKIVSEYLAAGVKQGEIVRYFADTTMPGDISAWLAEIGVELKDDDSFRIVKAESSYCPGGSFVPQQVLDNAVARYAMAKEAGYSGSRVTGEMSWVLRGIPGSDHLLEYEVSLNLIQDDFPHIGMCQYDARLFDGAMLFQVLQVHPYMVAQGQIVKNPFYIRPEEFLANLRANS